VLNIGHCFQVSRSMAPKGGFRERPERAERFFREDRAGQGKDLLTPARIKQIVDAHYEVMQLFGYLPDQH
jgi:hypothetical protein